MRTSNYAINRTCSVPYGALRGGVYLFINQLFASFSLSAQQPINSAIDHFLNARAHTLAQELLCSYSSQKKLALYVPIEAAERYCDAPGQKIYAEKIEGKIF